MNAYIDLHRHAAVRADLSRHGSIALRAMVAHVIAGTDHYRVDVESQRAPKEDIAESVETCGAEVIFDAQRRAVLGVLGFDPEAPTVTGSGYGRAGVARVFARLLELPDPVVLEVVAIVMGETLQAGSLAVEAIGLHLGTDMRRHWHADAAFFAQLRDREVLLAVVAEVAGADVAAANEKEKAKALKAIIADHLDGTNGRTQVAPWVPGWMAFPPAAYTARGGVGSVRAHARWGADLEAMIETEGTDGDSADVDMDIDADVQNDTEVETEAPPLAA